MRSDLAFAEHLDEQLRVIELYLTQPAKIDDPQAFGRRQTVPGIGPILAMVILHEVHDIGRFGSVPQFVSYCRLVKCSHELAGKKTTGKENKIGTAHLKWAFSDRLAADAVGTSGREERCGSAEKEARQGERDFDSVGAAGPHSLLDAQTQRVVR